MTDKQLIGQILKNNNFAFQSLVEKYKKLVYNTAYRLVRNYPDAEDIFQDVFLEVYKSCNYVKNEDDLTMWLYKIAYNKSISFLRKKNPAKAANQPEHEILQDSQIQKKYTEHNTPHKILEQKESVSQLYKFIDQLPDNQKKVLLMHKFEGFSQKEICEKLNLSTTSVESLIYRAKKNLKQKLSDYFKTQLKQR